MLNDTRVRSAKPRERIYRIADGGSLFLVVRPSGSKSWEFRFKRGGKVRGVVIGLYDDVGIAKARRERDRLKALLHDGQDPIAQKALAAELERRQVAELKARRAEERAVARAERLTFERVANEWIEAQRPHWTAQHADQVEQSLRDHVHPKIGRRRLDTLGTGDVLGVLDVMIDAGLLETAARVYQRFGAIFEHSALRHHTNVNPAALVKREFSKRLKAARKARPVEHFAAVSREELPALLRALRAYTGSARYLTWWLAYTACRIGEARRMEWGEIDRDKAVWRLPASRMKARRPHAIPLSRQALELLDEIPRDPRSPLVFRNPRDPKKPASENSVGVVFAALGYQGTMTAHGWRSVFSTAANESGLWRPDLIETALAHAERDTTRAAYMRSDFLEERRPMMAWWANELDRLETGGTAKVRSIRGKRA